jgi:hypothetical protein
MTPPRIVYVLPEFAEELVPGGGMARRSFLGRGIIILPVAWGGAMKRLLVLRFLFCLALVALAIGWWCQWNRYCEEKKSADREFSSHGPMNDRAEWPPEMKRLLADAARAGISVEPVRVYYAQNPDQHSFYWRMRASPQLIALMTSRWQLEPGSQSSIDYFWYRWPSDWESPNGHGRQEILVGEPPEWKASVLIDDSQQDLYGAMVIDF